MSIDDREKIYKFRGIGWTRSGLRQSGPAEYRPAVFLFVCKHFRI